MLAYNSQGAVQEHDCNIKILWLYIFNPEIGLKLSDRARLEDGGHVYCHDTLNEKLTPASQTQLLRAEFHLDLPGV